MSPGLQDIQIVIFTSGSLYKLTCLPPISASSLKQLKIQENQLTNIDSLAKYKYPCLQRIFIDQNKIHQLPALKAYNLIQIQIHSNQISSIQIFASAFYPNLKILELYNNKITSLPLIKAPKLWLIFLCSNQITTIEQFSKGTYPQLIQINIQKNKLRQFPKINADKLQKVQAGYNQITNINDFAQGNNMELKQINFTSNKLKYIPKFKSKNIRNAQFGNNLLQKTDFLKGHYQIIQKLSFSENNFTSFLQIIESFEQADAHQSNYQKQELNKELNKEDKQDDKKQKYLKLLIVNNNPLKQITLIPFKNLKYFMANNCKIESIQQFSKGIYNDLQTLFLCQNLITKLPKLNTPNLNDLRLNDNKIWDIEEFFSQKYQELKVLQLQNNKIKYLPQLKSDNVGFLNFAQNPLNGFEDKLFEYSYQGVEWIKFSIQNQNRLFELINSFQKLYTITFPVSICEWQILAVAGLFQEQSQCVNLSKYQVIEYLNNIYAKLKQRKEAMIEQTISGNQQKQQE